MLLSDKYFSSFQDEDYRKISRYFKELQKKVDEGKKLIEEQDAETADERKKTGEMVGKSNGEMIIGKEGREIEQEFRRESSEAKKYPT